MNHQPISGDLEPIAEPKTIHLEYDVVGILMVGRPRLEKGADDDPSAPTGIFAVDHLVPGTPSDNGAQDCGG